MAKTATAPACRTKISTAINTAFNTDTVPAFPAHFAQQYQSLQKHLRLKGLQPKTIDAYARGMRRIGKYFDYQVDALRPEQLTSYFTDMLDSHSWSGVKLDLYGLKFFTLHVLGRPWSMPSFIRPPKVSRLPDIVSVAQAQALFAATKVLSYRIFFFTLYSLGLRLSEGLALGVADIDADRMRVHVRDSKGNRDRFVPLPEQTLLVLRKFWRVHQHPQLLFPNRSGGLNGARNATSALDRAGVQRALHQVTLSCGLKKRSPRTACATAMPHT